MIRFSSLLFFVRDLTSATKFYTAGLKLQTISENSDFVLLKCVKSSLCIGLQQSYNEANLSTSYSPIVNFMVTDSFDETVYNLTSLGACMDGSIRYDVNGKSASFRAPDGHMIGIHEHTEISE